MPDGSPDSAAESSPLRPRRRRPLWRRILRATIWAVVVLVVLGGIGYYRATRPAVLREKLLKALAGVRHARIEFDDISFSPWDGLDVVELQIALEPHAPLVAPWPNPRAQPMLRIAHLNVQLDMPALLAGVTRPTAVRADGAAFTLIRDAVTGRTNWNFAAATPQEEADRDAMDYPLLRLDDADVQIFSADRGELHLVRRWIVDAVGDAETRDGRAGYRIRVDQVGGPGVLRADAPFPRAGELVTPAAHVRHDAQPPAPLASLWLGAGGRTIEASLAWIDLATLDAVLPRDLAARKRELELSGRATVETLRVRDGRLEAAEVRLDDLSFVVPVETSEPGAPPPPRFLKFDDFSGRLALELDRAQPLADRNAAPALTPVDPAHLRITACGRMGRSPCTLTVSADGALGAFSIDAPFPASAASQPPASTDDRLAGAATTRPGAGEALFAELAAIRDWPFASELRIDGFELPTESQQPQFVQSPNLPKALRAFFQDFEPRGQLDVRLMATRRPPPVTPDLPSTGAAPIIVEGEFIARGTSCRYYRFPYDIEDARGVFRLHDGAVTFDGLSGRHGAGRIRVDGRLAHTRGYGALDLTITGQSIALDADLYAALPDRYRHLWESAAPIGLSDIQATMRREEGTPETGGREVDVRVDARLLSASLAAGGGQRLRQVDGAVTIDRGIVTLHDLYGTLDGAGIRLSGTIDGNRRGATDANNLQLNASNVRIERRATIGGGETDPANSDLLTFVGRGDVSGRIRGSGGMLSRDAQYVVHIRGGELSSPDGGAPWQCGEGLVLTRGDFQEVRNLGGRFEGMWFEGAGVLPVAGGAGPAVSLEVRAGADDMSRLAPRLVPSRWRKHADVLSFSGPGKATMRIRPGPAVPGGVPGHAEQRAELQVESAGCRFVPVPLPLREFRAAATVNATGFEIQQATGRYGEKGEVRLSGRGDWGSAGESLDFKLDATSVQLGPEFVAAMPEALAGILRKLAPTGEATIRLEQLHRAAAAVGASWEIRGEVTFLGAALRLGLPLTAFDGELSGDCTVRPDGQADLAAGFTVHRGQLAGRPLERVEGLLVRTAGDRWIQLNDVRGRLCDGEVSGFGTIDPATAEYGVTLTLEDVRLDQFFPTDSPHAMANATANAVPQIDRPPPGRLDGRIFLRGKAGDDSSRRGGGDLRIRGASFIGTPILKDVAEASRAKTGRALDATDWIELKFVWEGSELKFQRVDLQSRDLRLVGEGHWNIDDDSLVMTLVGANPSNWPRVAVLSDLLETAGQELMQYRVTGTKKSPKVTAEPLHNLTEPIRRLIEGG